MPLQATSGAASYDAFGGGVPFEPIYIEQVFQNWLYNGNNSTQTITNGIDLAGKGGLVWAKRRDASGGNWLSDSARGVTNYLSSNNTDPQGAPPPTYVSSFNSNGFSIGSAISASAATYASWTFRKAEKFFDCVTYTGNGSARTIAHNLGSVPGCIIVKCTSNTYGWKVYHTSLGNNKWLELNLTDASATGTYWNNTTPTATVFSLSADAAVNASGETYVAYLFAHNAGGFGLTGTDNVISCGSFTSDSLGKATVTLNYEPQWVIIKRSDGASNWTMLDNMRGWAVTSSGDAALQANTSNAETSGTEWGFPTATGFSVNEPYGNATYIYIAIRRGPMKVPTTGTSVFSVQAYTGDDATRTLTTGFPVDLAIGESLSSSAGNSGTFSDRLRGTNRYVNTASTGAEVVGGNSLTSFAIQNGVGVNGPNNYVYNFGAIPYVLAAFRRAPGFFDEVCYRGDNTYANSQRAHNLGVAPELTIIKNRTNAESWQVLWNQQRANLNVAFGFDPSPYTANTSTLFSTSQYANGASSENYVAYLFASCPGVSKVGSFTGTGATQVINCGFTGGARFVLIKATSTTGDWYVWDSARGIVAGNDPYLRWNVNGNQVTNTDWVDTAATGFELSNAAGNLANSNGVSYIFLAIA